ncbi:hypothetical protein ACUIAK_20125 [Bacillus cytotoxicus]
MDEEGKEINEELDKESKRMVFGFFGDTPYEMYLGNVLKRGKSILHH